MKQPATSHWAWNKPNACLAHWKQTTKTGTNCEYITISPHISPRANPLPVCHTCHTLLWLSWINSRDLVPSKIPWHVVMHDTFQAHVASHTLLLLTPQPLFNTDFPPSVICIFHTPYYSNFMQSFHQYIITHYTPPHSCHQSCTNNNICSPSHLFCSPLESMHLAVVTPHTICHLAVIQIYILWILW